MKEGENKKMRYDPGCGPERAAFANIKSTISTNLGSIDAAIGNLEGNWQDEKSGEFIEGAKASVEKMYGFLEEAINTANSTFNQIDQNFSIYAGGGK